MTDVGQFLRLRSVIQQSVAAIDPKHQASSGNALPDAYKRFRAEALMIIPEEHKAEFDRICPDVDFGPPPGQHDIIKAAQRFNEAKAVLGALAGFLDGYVQEIQMRIQAQESARLQQESGGQYL